jgi:hypothetical protein
VQEMIAEGRVLVNDGLAKPSLKLRGGERISVLGEGGAVLPGISSGRSGARVGVWRGDDGDAVDCDWAGRGGRTDLVVKAGSEACAGANRGSYAVTNSSRSGVAEFHSGRHGSQYQHRPDLPRPGL